jgi:hypothetical protein
MRALVGGVIGTAVAAIALGAILVRRRGPASRVVSQIAPPARRQEALEELTKQQLYERARKANVADRSKMSKDGLIKALRATS